MMDRRQKKTREAIFNAFTELLSEKSYHQISVQDIIDTADIGRTTFYAHFETKDYLLKELCAELFDHIIDTAMGLPHRHACSYGDESDSVFLHLLRHLRENDRHILDLLASDNNELFLRYFKSELKKLIVSQYGVGNEAPHAALPEEYRIHHIASSFVEAVSWWISHRCKESPEEIAGYFAATVDPLINKN